MRRTTSVSQHVIVLGCYDSAVACPRSRARAERPFVAVSAPSAIDAHGDSPASYRRRRCRTRRRPWPRRWDARSGRRVTPPGKRLLLFGVISQRYERRSLVVTTNLPFARWSEVFLDATAAAAVIDRIVHHATVLTTAGDSYRLKVATRNQASRATQEVPRQIALVATWPPRRSAPSGHAATIFTTHRGSLFTWPKGPFSACHSQISWQVRPGRPRSTPRRIRHLLPRGARWPQRDAAQGRLGRAACRKGRSRLSLDYGRCLSGELVPRHLHLSVTRVDDDLGRANLGDHAWTSPTRIVCPTHYRILGVFMCGG